MAFDQAQGIFRTHKTFETTCTYLVFASQRKADEATNQDALFNAVGEVASWLSASDQHLLAFEVAKKVTAWASNKGPSTLFRQPAWFKAAREQELRSADQRLKAWRPRAIPQLGDSLSERDQRLCFGQAARPCGRIAGLLCSHSEPTLALGKDEFHCR
jgi:hypothetical protein